MTKKRPLFKIIACLLATAILIVAIMLGSDIVVNAEGKEHNAELAGKICGCLEEYCEVCLPAIADNEGNEPQYPEPCDCLEEDCEICSPAIADNEDNEPQYPKPCDCEEEDCEACLPVIADKEDNEPLYPESCDCEEEDCEICSVLFSEDFETAVILASGGATIDMSDADPPSSGDGWTFDNNVYTIENGATVIITGTNANWRRIAVKADARVNITLDNVSITGLGTEQSPLYLNSGAEVALTITGENTLRAGHNQAGIHVPGDTALTIDGTGSVTAYGGTNAAGIGGGGINRDIDRVGCITINGGTVIATGSSFLNGGAAGIGGGPASDDGGNITINGGTVIATGGAGVRRAGGGAGIGGGGFITDGKAGGTIIINGGTVTAIGGYGDLANNGGGAGIGGGGGSYEGGASGSITINGGVVTATGGINSAGRNGAAIGSGGNGIGEGPGVPSLPLAPTNFTIIGGTGQARLSWTPPANIVSYAGHGYEVTLDGINWVPVAAGHTSHTFDGLVGGATHSFRVRATFNHGHGLEATNPQPPRGGGTPPSVEATGGNDDSVEEVVPPPVEPTSPPTEASGNNVPTTLEPSLEVIDASSVDIEFAREGDGAITLDLPQIRIDEIIESSEASVVFNLTDMDHVVSVGILNEALEAFANAGLGITITFPQGVLRLDSEAVLSFISSAQDGADSLRFFLQEQEESQINPAQRAALLEGETIFEVVVLSGSTRIRGFAGSMALMAAFEDERTPTAAWYLSEIGERELIEFELDEDMGMIILFLPHLSFYVISFEDVAVPVIEEAVATPEQPVIPAPAPAPEQIGIVAEATRPDQARPGRLLFPIIAVLAILAIATAIILIARKKRKDKA